MVSRGKFIRTVSYLTALCAVFAAVGFFALRAKASYEQTLKKIRISSLCSLCEYSWDVGGGLRLLGVASGESAADGAAYVKARASGALASLGSFDEKRSRNLVRFFGGAHDFADGYAESDAGRETAISLSKYAREIYYHLSDLAARAMNGESSLVEFGSVCSGKDGDFFENELDFSNGAEKKIFALVEPASAGSARASADLNGKNATPEEAGKLAGEILRIAPALLREKLEIEDGKDVYCFSHGDSRVDVRKAGGILLRVIDPAPCGKKVYGSGEALKKAEEFLRERNFRGVRALSGETGDFTARFVFAPTTGGVLLATCPIKMEISLSSGKVVYFNAVKYAKNYRTDIKAEDARPNLGRRISPKLKINETLVCLAEIDGREKLCYLALCTFEGEPVKVYADYQTLKILKTEM